MRHLFLSLNKKYNRGIHVVGTMYVVEDINKMCMLLKWATQLNWLKTMKMNTPGNAKKGQEMILPTIQYSCLVTGCINVWTSSSFGKGKKLSCQVWNAWWDSRACRWLKKPKKSVAKASAFWNAEGTREERSILKLWNVYSWFAWYLCLCHCLLGLLCLSDNKSVRIAYRPHHIIDMNIFWAYYLNGEFVYVLLIIRRTWL